jgi:hypothetical protein
VGVYTHVDSANPFGFLLSTECSPFSPYCWHCTGALIVRTKHGYCRPKKSQSEGKKFVDEHFWVRGDVAEMETQTPSLFIGLVLHEMIFGHALCSYTLQNP